MPTISANQLRQHNGYLAALDTDRHEWLSLWREVSDNYLPQRYRWLLTGREYYANRARRQYILNNTGTRAARILAAGMMNGITSPSRPWFKLRIPGVDVTRERPLALWLEEVERILLRIMAESNFYNSMAVLYLDMAVFGTAASLIYSDRESVIRCYNPPLGEYYLASSARDDVGTFARRFSVTVQQYIERWPDRRYWSERVKNLIEGQNAGSRMQERVDISHVIAPNHDGLVPSRFSHYELYWETKRTVSLEGDTAPVLEKKGFNEKPGIFARWEVSGSDAYGVSPAMDALGDNIELQHLHRQKAQLLEKVHKPPVLIDLMLQNNPVALMPNGKTYVPNLGTNAGARPIYQVNPNFSEINLDQMSIEKRIRDAFYNPLFTGITDLDTVRSATEVNVRESEKLILLGGVLERFESEALDPAIKRVFSIAERAQLIPPLPQGYNEIEMDIQYVSILSIAQRASGTAPTERFIQMLGAVAAIYPDSLDIPDFDQLLTNYARDIGVRESELKDQEVVQGQRQERQQMLASQQALEAGNSLSASAKNLSEAEVGGGANALQRMLGG